MKSKWTNRILVGVLTVFVLVLGVTAVFAQTPDTSTPESAPETDTFAQPGRGGRGGAFGQRGIDKGGDTYLADALGITAEELDAAQEAANVAAIEQAVEAGLLTQEQADRILSGEALGMRGFGSKGLGHLGAESDEAAIDHTALLADALGITVDELDAARAEAKDAAIAQAVADGTITQEQVELMEARAALKDVIDGEAIVADVLDISVEELQAARQDRDSMAQLLEDSGMTTTEFMEALQTAYADAVAQAVADGVISQAQADLLSENGLDGFHGAGGRGHHGRG